MQREANLNRYKFFKALTLWNVVLAASAFFIFTPLLAYSQAINCKALLKKAQILRKDTYKDLSTQKKREKFIEALEKVINELEPCAEQVIDRELRLQINTIISSSKIKIRMLKKKAKIPLPGDCMECKSIEECIKICKGWQKENNYCRKTYRDNIEQFETLDCDTCIKNLGDYYSLAEEIIRNEKLDENKKYSQDTIRALWGNLYKISQDPNCIKKSQKEIKDIMLPPSIPPDDLVTYLAKIISGLTPEKYKQLQEKMKKYTKNDATLLLNFFLGIVEKIDPNVIKTLDLSPLESGEILINALKKSPSDYKKLIKQMENFSVKDTALLLQFFTDMVSKEDIKNILLWQNLFKSLMEYAPAQRRLLIETLPNMQWERFNNLLDEIINAVPNEGTILISNFMMTEAPTEMDITNVNYLNHRLRAIVKEMYNSPVENIEFPNLERIGGMQIGTDCQFRARREDDNIHFKIVGYISRYEEKYVLMLRFLSKKNLIIYSENLELSLNQATSNAKIKDLFKGAFDNFNNFIKTLKILPLNKSKLIIDYTDFTRIEAFINKAVYEDAKIYELVDKEGLQDINGVYVGGGIFWEGDVEANKIFGNDLRDLIYERINKLYMLKRPHSLLREKPPDHNYLYVKGEYEKKVNAEKSSVTISYGIGPKTYSETEIYFPKEKIKNDIDKKKVKATIVVIVSNAIANYLNLTPAIVKLTQGKEEEKITPPPVHSLKHKYLTSFFMPGYIRTYSEGKEKPSKWYTTWNYSNISLLTLSMASEAIYINSNYDEGKEEFFWAGIIGSGLFIANGALGMVHAKMYNPPINKKLAYRPFISINTKNNNPLLLFTFTF